MSRYIDADTYIKYCDEHWIPLNVDAVNEQPTADVVPTVFHDKCMQIEIEKRRNMVEVVHGEWVKMDKRGNNVQCSKCGNTLDLRGVNAGRGDANYCPNCGAKMSTQSNAFLTH